MRGTTAGPRGFLDAMWRDTRRYLPKGDPLPDGNWQQRHKAILTLLWAHAIFIPVVAVLEDLSPLHALLEGGAITVAAVVASATVFDRGVRMVAATLGLISSSAVLVHISGGLIEMHFHFFVMVAIVTLYQSWLPFLVAIGYVLIHHGIVGILAPESVYNHPGAQSNPWRWALVHAAFIMGESVAGLIAWRLNESARAESVESHERQLEGEQGRLEAQQKYVQIFDNVLEGIYETKPDGTLTAGNPALAHMLGFSSVDELMGSMQDVGSVWLKPERRPDFLRLLDENEAIHEFEFQARRRDGSIVWLSDSARAIRDDAGTLSAIQGSLEDITARKDAEAALKEREEQFRLLFESNPLPMWVYELESLAFVAVNRSAIIRYGYSEAELLRMRITDLHRESDVQGLLDAARVERPVHQHSGPWLHLTKDGSELHAEIISHLLDFRGRPAALVVASDVTERVESERQREGLEEQLRQSQKMEAVGRLAGGIAHDFNNLLGVIINYADFVLDDLDPDDPCRQDVEEVRAAGQRGANLVRQILAFSRRDIVHLQVVDLNVVVADMQRLLGRAIGEDVALELHRDEELWPTKVDVGQIEQVLMNLAINARDAMPEGGRVLIETANVGAGDMSRELASAANVDHVCLSVTDSGIGMTEAVAARIFDPFFTTKPAGVGTGLGLSLVYGTVQQAKGQVTVQSEPNAGTTFRIYLPVSGVEDSSGVERPRASRSGAGQTIMLVEDERAVRELARRILTQGGYNVVSLASGEEAAALYDKGSRDVDLLLTDVVMPGMSGRELCERLREKDDDLKTLYMSGYTDEVIAQRGVLQEGQELIQKPFNAGELLQKVGELLAPR